jgi:type I restriction enzyme S subunit
MKKTEMMENLCCKKKEDTNRVLNRSILKEKDILIVIAGATIGKVAILEKEFLPANTNQAVCFIRLKRQEQSKFVWYYLQSDLIRTLVSLNSVQSAQPNLSMGLVKELLFPCPLLPEQQLIATFLDRETAKLDTLITKVESAILKLKEYRTALISAAVTGKIDVSTALNAAIQGAA